MIFVGRPKPCRVEIRPEILSACTGRDVVLFGSDSHRRRALAGADDDNPPALGGTGGRCGGRQVEGWAVV